MASKFKEVRTIKLIPRALLNMVTDPESDLFDERALQDLEPMHEAIIADMKKRGFDPAHPLEVRANKANANFDIVTGRFRYRCAGEANIDLIPCKLVTYEGADALDAIFRENELRKQDNILIKARKILRYKTMTGSSDSVIAERYGENKQTVKNVLQVLEKGVPELHKAIVDGTILASTAYKVAIMNPEIQPEAVFHIVNNNLNTVDAAKLISTMKGAAEEAGEEVEEDGGTQEEKTAAQKAAATRAANKAKLAKLYGPLGKKVLEHFEGLTAELPDAFIQGIRFALNGFQVGEEGVVHGLEDAQNEYLVAKGLKKKVEED